MPIETDAEGYLTTESELVISRAFNMMAGEPLILRILNEEEEVIIDKRYVIYPILVGNEKGMRMSIELCDPTFRNFLVKAWGLEPNEKILHGRGSDYFVINVPITADENGEVQIEVTPSEEEKASGLLSETLTGKNGTFQIKLPWGDAYTNWALQQKKFSSSVHITEKIFRNRKVI